MNISRAIEILDEEPIICEPGRKPELEAALQLGIEALKRIKYLQGIALYRTDTHLPGETED